MKNVLLHGASGFVSHSLVDRLLEEGFLKYFLVDIRSIPKDTIKNIEDKGGSVSTYRKGKLCDIKITEKIDAIISLAGQTDVDIALSHPCLAYKANIDIAVDLAEFLKGLNYNPKVIYVSSDSLVQYEMSLNGRRISNMK